MVVGIVLGVLIGIVTTVMGVVLIGAVGHLIILLTGGAQVNLVLKSIAWVLSQLIAIPSFWFGGPWLGGKILAGADWRGILPYYMGSLFIVFVPFMIYLLVPLVKGIENILNKL